MQYISDIMAQYGYFVIVLSLCLGILAAPIPLEAVMGYAGVMSYQGDLNTFGSILASATGTTLAMFITYGIGYKLGMPFFERYGERIHLGPARINQISNWFNRHGNYLIVIIYFIPGIRHFTGYFAGITRMKFPVFALYSFFGSFLWVTPFVIGGKALGPNWEGFYQWMHEHVVQGSTFLIIAVGLFILIRKYRILILGYVSKSFSFLKSRIRVYISIVSTFVLVAGLIIYMIMA